MDGVFLIDKTIGLTSRSVCNQISRAYKNKKVGHVGTLDPFASGLLIVAMGKCTKAVTFFDESIKEYEAVIQLFKETDTLDNTGKLIKEEPIKEIDIEEINEAINSFLGEVEQIPPMTSAIHVNGKRLYEYAHEGKEVTRPTRKVFIYDIKMKSYDKKSGLLAFYCKVSKGTYVRTLGSDIAKKLHTVGYLDSLRRVGVSPFQINETSSLEDVINKDINPLSTFDVLSRFINYITLDDKMILDIENGKVKYLNIDNNEKRIMVVDSKKRAIAIYERNGDNKLEFVRGLF